VNYIFTNRVLSIPDVSIVDRKNLGEGFWLYKVGEHDLFEVLDEMPEIIPKERAAMRTWLFGEGPENICHEIRPGIEEDPKQGHISYEGADVKILAKNDLLSEFRIEVNSDKPVPILMKQTYSERWKVTSDGVELKTYRASPYLTLFYGKGVIDIRFAKSRINEVGNFLSVLGVLWGFWLLWVRFRRRAAS
jgi:hypothetical protein